jgi:hypothetical protein
VFGALIKSRVHGEDLRRRDPFRKPSKRASHQ